MKWDRISGFRERHLAPCAYITNGDAKPRSRTDLPGPRRPAFVEDLFQPVMLSADFRGLSPQYRRLIEKLFLETPPRTYTEVAADSGPGRGRSECYGRRASRTCVGDSPNWDFDNANW
jgi:hypothetical protein